MRCYVRPPVLPHWRQTPGGGSRNNSFLEALKKQDDLVTEFDEELWYITVDRVNVHADERLSIIFRDYVAVDVPPEK